MNFLDRADALAKRLERFFSGGGPQDPLYVSNRTAGQKIRLILIVGTPLLAIGCFIVLSMNGYFDPPAQPERTAVASPTGDQTATVLTHVEKELATSSRYSRAIEVLEAAVSRGPDHLLSGKLRNTTEHPVRAVELVFDVTDEDGSALGGVSVSLENIPAGATVPFRKALEQTTARSALVREVHSR